MGVRRRRRTCFEHGALVAADEMEIHLVPVLVGDGRRLFDHLGGDHIELDLV